MCGVVLRLTSASLDIGAIGVFETAKLCNEPILDVLLPGYEDFWSGAFGVYGL